MQPVRRAVIDVGTNSIKLLVAEVDGREVRPVWEESRQTRLGSGFYETHRLQPDAVERTAQAVAEFAQAARDQQAQSVRVFATSAARDAVNPEALLDAVERTAGLHVEIISGEQEADWAYRGVTTDPELASNPLLLLEVGGGSTQLILGHGDHKDFRHSFPLGTVRLLETLPHSNPPRREEFTACREWLARFVQAEVRPRLEPEMRWEVEQAGAVRLVGTGGTATILACIEAQLIGFDRARIEAARLSGERLRWHTERLWTMELEARRQIIGLPKNRADVILMGAAIYDAVMEQFGFAELRVSTRGLRFGAVMDAVE